MVSVNFLSVLLIPLLVVSCITVLFHVYHHEQPNQQQQFFAESYCGEGTVFDALKQHCVADLRQLQHPITDTIDKKSAKYDTLFKIDNELSRHYHTPSLLRKVSKAADPQRQDQDNKTRHIVKRISKSSSKIENSRRVKQSKNCAKTPKKAKKKKNKSKICTSKIESDYILPKEGPFSAIPTPPGPHLAGLIEGLKAWVVGIEKYETPFAIRFTRLIDTLDWNCAATYSTGWKDAITKNKKTLIYAPWKITLGNDSKNIFRESRYLYSIACFTHTSW